MTIPRMMKVNWFASYYNHCFLLKRRYTGT